MYCGLKQGQITPNIENKYVLKLIHFVAQCPKIANTVLFLKRILYHFSASCCFLLVMSECPKVHFVALRFINNYISSNVNDQLQSVNDIISSHSSNSDFLNFELTAKGVMTNVNGALH